MRRPTVLTLATRSPLFLFVILLEPKTSFRVQLPVAAPFPLLHAAQKSRETETLFGSTRNHARLVCRIAVRYLTFLPPLLPLANCCLPTQSSLAPRFPQRPSSKSTSAAAMVTPNSCSSDMPDSKVDPRAGCSKCSYSAHGPPSNSRKGCSALYQVREFARGLVPERRQESGRPASTTPCPLTIC
ncbi:hypothetical protein M441DRAFT_54162 [Trichoderma asperellum CBS 433.97]|uniref:Secreted protein n=1 Tax=Trichoderma asperellum (strain ATCC 204424 / CBS 433.97 / NBRC 101777) TaxID=1042311 RepID=A0A2T3ZJT9_TRIA4|nr:hypothetical protein M441DRAFT_54162 [Trichoderma asperellum CBS 433.97]PTB45070.1 hypothetical protein M441DRAFT_54162 [Trichoderma asperellum CBS 433.97]